MSCNPQRWLWGVIPIAMLSWIAYARELPSIEADLMRRSEVRLKGLGHEWAAVRFTGRDAQLAGRATDEHAPKDALMALRSIWGVRSVDLRTDLVDKVAVYTWSATRRDGRIRLSGYVPSEAMRKTVIAAARANFPRATIDDKMTFARGAPDRELWLGAVGFGLKQLAGLKNGEVALKGNALSVSGEAADPASYKSLERAFAQSLPQGLRLTKSTVAAPAISPFTWSARLGHNQLELSGYAPTDAARDELFARAKKAFPKAAIVDRTQTAGGAPADWAEAASVSLELLASLQEGAIELRDRALSLSGTVADAAGADALRRLLRERMPAAFKVADTIALGNPLTTGATPLQDAAAAAPTPGEQRQKEAALCQERLSDSASKGVIEFERASAEIDPKSAPTLDRLAEIAKECPSARIDIAGHTDGEGEPERNQSLSRRRAEAVTSYLIGAGVGADRLNSIGYGDLRPIAPNDTPENRARNRRIEFTVQSN